MIDDNLFHTKEFYTLMERVNGLDKFLNLRIEELIKTVNVANDNLKESTSLAQKQLKEHQEASNNLQRLMKEQSTDFERRSREDAMNIEKKLKDYLDIQTHLLYTKAVDKEINDIKMWQSGVSTELKLKANQEAINRSNKYMVFVAIISSIGLVISILTFLLKH